MILILLSSLFVIALIYHLYWKRRNLPPGPTPLPFVGNLLALYFYEPGYEAFRNWKDQYGRCFTFWMANRPAVVIADYELMKETIVKDGASYTGRQEMPFSRNVRGGDYGIVETSGLLWQTHRRFVLHALRDFGMGKDVMQERVLVEVADFLKKCEKHVGEPLDLRDHLDTAVGSVINSLLFGFRFDESNMDQFLHRKAVIARIMEKSARPAFILWMLFPCLRVLPFFWKYNRVSFSNKPFVLSDVYGDLRNKVLYVLTKAEENKHLLFDMFDEQIRLHKEEIDFDCEGSTDYVEAYLKEQKRLEAEPENGSFTHDQLRNMCFDLWMAGMETTSNTLYWGVLYVLRHPKVQEKMHMELDVEIASQRQITMADRGSLHYMNAVIQEVQRLANLLPLNVFRETTCDVEIEGYSVPAGTLVLPQISTVMYDEKVFPRPYDFEPSRHLANDGTFMKIEQMVPFSLGKRQCAGEGLARMELFLFLANFFNKFKVASPAGQYPSTRKKFGSTVRAQGYSVVLKERR